MLAEANRVTKDGGFIFLTTPNAASLRNITQLLRMRTPGECPYYRPAKAPGARHNREWTPLELKAALRAAGYDAAKLETRPLLEPAGILSLDSLIVELVKVFRLRGDSIFALARKASAVRERFPTEEHLYYSWDAQANRDFLDRARD